MPKAYNYKDKLMFKAHREGFRARSVYKLQELDKKYHLLSPNQTILDVGAYPGSWLQYASAEVGESGKIVGFDLQPISWVADNVTTFIGDMTEIPDIKQKLSELKFNKFDRVLSDIAPNTSGIGYVDQKKSVELTYNVFQLAKEVLRPGGVLVMKVFDGEDFPKLLRQLKSYFRNVEVMKVSASRDRSREVYVVCR